MANLDFTIPVGIDTDGLAYTFGKGMAPEYLIDFIMKIDTHVGDVDFTQALVNKLQGVIEFEQP